MAIATLGLSFLMTGDPDRARKLLEEALSIQTAEGYPFGEGQASLYLGITLEATDPQAATRHYHHAVECLREYRDSNMLPSALVGQAGLIARRDPARALRVMAAAWAIRARGGGDFPGFFRERLRRVRQTCEGVVGADADPTSQKESDACWISSRWSRATMLVRASSHPWAVGRRCAWSPRPTIWRTPSPARHRAP